MAAIIANEFFKGKREWSKIKDQILGSYLAAYLPKVKKLRKRILLVDAFAGPGKFDDEKAGSPLIFCQMADKYVPNNYLGIFVNREKEHHESLQKLLDKQIKQGNAIAVLGDAKDLLKELKAILTDETLLIYLDPFGLNGCEFNTILPFISRDLKHSSELIMNISVPIMHRLAAKKNVREGNIDNRIQSMHNTLSGVLGGDYWKKYLLDDSLSASKQIEKVMEHYKSILQEYLPVVTYCPVYESTQKSTVKYYMFAASRHIDTATLMNDIMFSAFWKHIWKVTTQGTLFENEGVEFVLPENYSVSLRSEILDRLKGRKVARKQLWQVIVYDCFMRYKASDFRKEIAKLVKEGKVAFVDVAGTGRLNDNAKIYLK